MDSSTELLAVCAEQPIQTTDLDAGEFTEPEQMPIVAATAQVPSDNSVIQDWGQVLKEKYAPRFPEVDGMPPHNWLPLLDDGQMSRLCRSVQQIETALDQAAVSASQPNTILNSPENRERVHEAFLTLRADVMNVREELQELLNVMWSQ